MKKLLLSLFLFSFSYQTLYCAEAADVSPQFKLLSTVTKHERTIQSVAFNRDESLIVTSSDDKTAGIWDLKTNQCLQILEGHSDWVRHATFSPDGKMVGTASDDCTAKIWDTSTGKCLHTLMHSISPHSIFFDLNCQKVITVCDNSSVRIWESKNGEFLDVNFYNERTFSAAFNIGKQQVALRLKSGSVIIKSPYGFFSDKILTGHTYQVNSVAFNHDDSLLVTGSHDRTAKIWDLQSNQCLHTLKGHRCYVNSAVFGPNQNEITTASSDGTLKLWDAETGACLHTLQLVKQADGKEILSPYQSGPAIYPIIKKAIYNSSGTRLVIITSDDRVQLWSVDNSVSLDQLVAAHYINFLKRLAIAQSLPFDKYALLHVLIKKESKDFQIKTEWLLKTLKAEFTKKTFTQHVVQALEKSNLEKMRILFEHLNNLAVQLPKEDLWKLWHKVCQEQEFDIDKAQFLLRQLEYAGEVIPEEVNRLMLENTDKYKLFNLRPDCPPEEW